MLRVAFIAAWLVSCANGLAFPTLHKRNTTVLGDVRERNVPLRVLPLGDSITNGVGSTDKNGYRELFVEMAEQGGPVQMIGSREGRGDMPKNESHNDGWNGYTINAISQKADNALRAKPNLVLLLAGTNNMNNASQAATAPSDIRNLIDKPKIFVQTPRTAILAGTIPVSTWVGRQPLNNQYNQALEGIIDQYAQEGKHILVVPINATIATDELKDGLHPNDDGYERMAMAWVQGVNQAQDQGWFQEPEAGDGYVAPQSSGVPNFLVRDSAWHVIVLLLVMLVVVAP